jgi:hypothetical protein
MRGLRSYPGRSPDLQQVVEHGLKPYGIKHDRFAPVELLNGSDIYLSPSICRNGLSPKRTSHWRNGFSARADSEMTAGGQPSQTPLRCRFLSTEFH